MDQFRKSPRAKFISYDSGDYFITVCTENKKHYFGEINDGKMNLGEIGRFLNNELARCNEIKNDIEMLQYVVMPNHFHAMVRVAANLSSKEIVTGIYQRNPNPAERANFSCKRHIPALSKYVGALKGVVTKFAKSKDMDFGWQSRFHDHLIRGINDWNNIGEYISNNVDNWHSDCFF